MKNRNTEGWSLAVAALLVFIIYGLMAWSLAAGDLTPGYVFTSGEKNITHTKLNTLVDGAVLNPSAFTDRAATTTPAGSDSLLLYYGLAADLRRVTVSDLVWRTVSLVTNQVEYFSPLTNDYLLTYSQAGNDYRKIRAGILFSNWPTLFGNGTHVQTLAAATNDTRFLVWDNGTNGGFGTNGGYGTLTVPALLGSSNIAALFGAVVLTNLPLNTLPTNTVLTNGETFVVWDRTNNRAAQALLSALMGSTYEYPIAGAMSFSTNHYLASRPTRLRTVLACKTNDCGYLQGDELSADSFWLADGSPLLSSGANSSNVFVKWQTWLTTYYVVSNNATAGVGTIINNARWRVKAYYSLN